MKNLREINERIAEIRSLLESDKQLRTDELEVIEEELRTLNTEKSQIEKRRLTASGISDGTVEARLFGQNPLAEGYKAMKDFENMKPLEVRGTEEYRSAFFKSLQGKDLTDVEKRAFTSGTTSGGAAVPTTTYDQVLIKLKQTQALFPHIMVTNLPGNVTIPVEIGEATASWVDELLDIPETGNPIGSVKLGGFTLAKLIPISIAAETMTAAAFESYLVEIITQKMSIEIEKAILSGNGASQPTGILTGIPWTNDVNNFTFDITTGLEYDHILKPLATLGAAYLPNAAWCMRSSTLYTQVAGILTADGESVFIQNGAEGFAGKIMGKPVIIDDYMPANTILFGSYIYYFMNFSQPIMFEKSRESGFRKATVDYRGVAVVDGKPAMAEAFIKIEPAA